MPWDEFDDFDDRFMCASYFERPKNLTVEPKRSLDKILKAKPSPKTASWPKDNLITDLVELCKVSWMYDQPERLPAPMEVGMGIGELNPYYGRSLRDDIFTILKEHKKL